MHGEFSQVGLDGFVTPWLRVRNAMCKKRRCHVKKGF